MVTIHNGDSGMVVPRFLLFFISYQFSDNPFQLSTMHEW
jgi:hypothetical protein